MKITDIRCHIVGEVRNFLFVVVETDEGIVGYGEGGITWREDAMKGFIEALKPSLIGQDPRRTEHLWQVMFRCGFFPAGRAGAAAISAVDIALWDIKAKALGVPLFELLGGKVRDYVVCYPHIVGDTPEALAAAAKSKVAEGWKFVRFNVAERGLTYEPQRSVQDCIEQFAAIREAVGPDVEMIVDVHTRLDPSASITLCRGLEPYRPFFVEDPVRCELPAALGKVAEATRVPIGAGEQYGSKWEFREAIEKQWIDHARIDVCIVGGLTEAKKVAGWCETYYIPIAPHNPLGPVSTAACMHLDFATPNFSVQETARPPGEVLPELFPVQAPFEQGRLLLPTAPGLGIEMDEAAVAAYPAIHGEDCPRFERLDGSFTNW